MGLSTFIFTWNTQTVRYNIEGAPEADFIDDLRDAIFDSNCDLAVIGLQEDAIRDSPLLQDEDSLIPQAISSKYTLLEMVTLSGWGITTYKALKEEWRYQPRGLRLAIFKLNDSPLEVLELQTAEMVSPGLKDWITAGKGAVAINIKTNVGSSTFINIHLPFNSHRLITGNNEALMWQISCLRSLYDNIVACYPADNVFLLGDLNFRVRVDIGASEAARKMFEEPGYRKELMTGADELHLILEFSRQNKGDLPDLREGVDNQGPTFYPTCKLLHGRGELSAESYKFGKYDQRVPSWCDRILYCGDGVDCIEYKSWDNGEMNMSDHSAVIGIYEIK